VGGRAIVLGIYGVHKSKANTELLDVLLLSMAMLSWGGRAYGHNILEKRRTSELKDRE